MAAPSEPTSLFPPAVFETVGRDISDQVYERLAELTPGGAPIDTAAYRPALASGWERVDSLTWRFHLRPGARWQDGKPVTAEDVRFSFDAFSDSVIDSPARASLAGVSVVPEDSATFLVRFAAPSPEQLYDATWHVRVVPEHIWSAVPRSEWANDTVPSRLVGSGRYRLTGWKRGQYVTLEADSTSGKAPPVRRIIWRFAPDMDAALNLVMSHEADLLETVGSPERARRVAADTTLRLVPYAAAVYGFLGFKINGSGNRPHPVLGDRATRRALTGLIDRRSLATSLFGPETKIPPGPMSQLLWIWDDSIRTLAFDTARAAAALDSAGWRLPPGAKVRHRGGQELAFDILVPSTSVARRQLALQMQEMWRRAGAAVTVTAVDFPIFQQRLARGRFDAFVGAWLDEPSPRGLSDQWTRAGWAGLNYGHYANPHFDSLFAVAGQASNVETARRLYREAMDTLNADAPAIFLYAPSNIAVVARRIEGLDVNPYSWASGLSASRAVH